MGGMEPRLAIMPPWSIPAGTSHYPETRSLSFSYINDKKLYTGLHTHTHSFCELFCFVLFWSTQDWGCVCVKMRT